MTLIVLTDGIWEGSQREEAVADRIADFYKVWHQKWQGAEDRFSSIQFVSIWADEVDSFFCRCTTKYQ